ncbi:nucleotide exchange factor GrpE [Halalkalibacterium halodurans]|uniref:nucleotide exchange factor GrpE n=1 Tax=Halalkalibacterium halodurans TaxID=86665 RepID=UPI001068B28B|nr:nucleotide exchange factor GrpE [Halalkalibacterium halodurans]MED3648601.1 nucleotide exchange factor GrpE [Halalkalibacterium halodurans]TES48950.1 nucleotide exchange factor GrpE [Halalkalibacterium halodurans]
MKFMFWKKEESLLIQELREAREQFSSMEEKLSDMDKQIQKATRLQYKTGKNIEGKLGDIGSLLDARKETGTVPLSDAAIEKLIRQVDDMDLVHAGLAEDTQWAELLIKWKDSLLSLLAEAGVRDSVRPGDMFDPALAEAVEAVELAEPHRPFEVFRVYKRTFTNSSGEVIRKGQVATVKEERK